MVPSLHVHACGLDLYSKGCLLLPADTRESLHLPIDLGMEQTHWLFWDPLPILRNVSSK